MLKACAAIYSLTLLLTYQLFWSDCLDAQEKKEAAASSPAIRESGLHAFVQTGSELHYIRDISHRDLRISSFSLDSGGERFVEVRGGASSKNVEIFKEELTDFGSTHIGLPVSKRVYVFNPTKSAITLYAITSAASNFHCSFFDTNELLPKGNASAKIFFLPVAEEQIEDVIVVHTSAGKFSHRVRGEGVGNPYRLRPMSGIRIPLNASFTSPIELHNPHDEPLRVLEMFSSDTIAHLEFGTADAVDRQLPSVMRTMKTPYSAGRWRLAPYETKLLNRLRIVGSVERNSTSFIHIVGELGGRGHRIAILIPVEYVVTRRNEVFSTQPILDFGLLREGQLSARHNFTVFTNIERGVEIESVYVSKSLPRLHGIHLQFASHPPVAVRCGARNQPGADVPLVSVWVGDSTAYPAVQQETNGDLKEEKMIKRSGYITAESRGGNFNVTVPYEALIYRGELLPNWDDIAFHSDLQPTVTRSVRLTNTLPFGVAIWNASIFGPAKESFAVRVASEGGIVQLAPSQTSIALILQYVKSRLPSMGKAACLVRTNVTDFKIPIRLFTGRIKVEFPHRKAGNFNFGTMKLGERRTIVFSIANTNPVAIPISEFHHPLGNQGSLRLIKIESRDHDAHHPAVHGSPSRLDTNLASLEGGDLHLPAKSRALFNFSIVPDSLLNNSAADALSLSLHTPFQHFEYPIYYELWNCSVSSFPASIQLPDSYIGTVRTMQIKIYNTCPVNITVQRLSIASNDTRFYLSSSKSDGYDPLPPIIGRGGKVTTIANLSFIPEAACRSAAISEWSGGQASENECYVGIPLDTPDGQWFAYGMKLPQNLAEIDYYLHDRLRKKWVACNKSVETTLLLDTDRVKNFEIPVQGQLVWPRLISQPIVHFPLTPVGNFSIVNLTLDNPTTRPIIVQLLPLVIYPDADSMLEFFHDQFPTASVDRLDMNETLMFTLRDTELFTLRPGSPTPKLRAEVERVVGSAVPRFTLSMILQPGMRARVRVGFLPYDYETHSTLLIIRNNLTALEAVLLYGKGTQIGIQIDNKTARGEPLLFDIQTSHLVDCFNPRRHLHKLPTTLTVKRSFAVKNSGDVAFSVINMSISNFACENRGFRILNCQPFRLEPGDIHTLDIAYTPDFIQAVNEGRLQIYMHMNGTPWVFDLAALIPKHMLSLCHSALPRPPFERLMYYSCILALIFCLICTVSCAYLEGDRVITSAIRQQFLKEREVNSVNSANGASEERNGQRDLDRQNNRPKRSFAATAKRLRNKTYVRVEEGSPTVSRLFWRSANCVLWLISHVWLTLRSDELEEGDWSEEGTEGAGDAPEALARSYSQHSPSAAEQQVQDETSPEVLSDPVQEVMPAKKEKSTKARRRKITGGEIEASSAVKQETPRSTELGDDAAWIITPSNDRAKPQLAKHQDKAAWPSVKLDQEGDRQGALEAGEEEPSLYQRTEEEENEKLTASDEEEALPEWAEENEDAISPHGGDLDEELAVLASQTATLFNGRGSPSYSKSSSIGDESIGGGDASLGASCSLEEFHSLILPTHPPITSGKDGTEARSLDELNRIKDKNLRESVEQTTKIFRHHLIRAVLEAERGHRNETNLLSQNNALKEIAGKVALECGFSLKLPPGFGQDDMLGDLMRNTEQVLERGNATGTGHPSVIGDRRPGRSDNHSTGENSSAEKNPFDVIFFADDPTWRPIFEAIDD